MDKNLKNLIKLLDYNEWANVRVANLLKTLEPEVLYRPLESSFNSLALTFGHIVSSEWVWLERWKGESPAAFPKWASGSDLNELFSIFETISQDRKRFLKHLQEGDPQPILTYQNLSGATFTQPLIDLFVHVVNHSTYHRGQLATLLRQVGVKPVATDYIVFLREMDLSGDVSRA